MYIFATTHFRRKYRKLSATLRQKATEQEKIFQNNPFDPRLETHKLHGKYKDYWAFSITSSYRIMFEFSGKDTVTFIDIDDHSIYQ